MSSHPKPPELKLDWCTHEAAKFAVEHWHYSRALPTPPIVKIGVWENGRFIGVVLFSRGASSALGSPYGLGTTEICELTRVALDKHQTPVTRIVAIAMRMLRKICPGLRLIVSFADPNEGHHGGIYQGGGWIYCGKSAGTQKFVDKSGRAWHNRQVSKDGFRKQYGVLRRVPKTTDCTIVPQMGKHRYLMPLDEAMRAQVDKLKKPYPKRNAQEALEHAAGFQSAEGGQNPTPALQNSKSKAGGPSPASRVSKRIRRRANG